MKRIIDMHTHSTASDGDLTPHDLIMLARRKGIKTISITDHDTLQGNIALTDDDKRSIEYINGIELSAKIKINPENKVPRMHILGYGIDLNKGRLKEKMQELHDISIYSVISYLNQLKTDYDISFSEEDVMSLLNTDKNIGRPDIAKLCIKYGYANSVNEAFDKYLIDVYAKTKNNNRGISPEECISLIRESNGIPVLAHPHSLLQSYKELSSTLKELKSYGLQGLEVYHSYHTSLQKVDYLSLAVQNNLLISGGTDYHGVTVKPNIEIGSGINCNINIRELSLLKELRKRQ